MWLRYLGQGLDFCFEEYPGKQNLLITCHVDGRLTICLSSPGSGPLQKLCLAFRSTDLVELTAP